jgi:hypothetical protein
MDHPSMVTARRQLATLIREKAFEQPTIWGFKDPRLNVLLPLYEQAFAECGVEPVYVICLRDPRSVASSLQRIHDFPRIFSELLWIDNTMSGIQVARKRIGAVVHYENWFRAGQVQLQSAINGLGLEETGEAPAVLENIVERELNHAESGTTPFALAYTESIYGHLKTGDYEAAASEFAKIKKALKFARLPGANLFRLCWRAEHEPFTHAQSITLWVDIDPGAKTIRLSIPPGDWIGLRLELGGRMGLARLFALRVLNQTGQVLWDWNGQPESLAGSGTNQVDFLTSSGGPGGMVHFAGPDAALGLPVLPQMGPLRSEGGVLELEFGWLITNSLGGFDFSRGVSDELAAVRSELEALRRELAEKTAETANCRTTIASQQQELAAHQKVLAGCDKVLAERSREADLSRDHVNALSAAIAGYQAEKRDVLQSWSWRLTAPLRLSGSLFRR